MDWLKKLFGFGFQSEGNLPVGKASSPGGSLRLRDVSLGKLHPGTLWPTLVGSPDSRRVAYFARRASKWFAVVDGRDGTEYDLPPPSGELPSDDLDQVSKELDTRPLALGPILGRPLFSPDSRRIAYIAYRRATQEIFRHLGVRTPLKQFVVVDGEEGEKYDRIIQKMLSFSPDSKRVAYAAERQGKFVIVADGQEGQEYEDIFRPVFSPDSRHLAYVAGKVGRRSAVVDGVNVSAKYQDVGGATGIVFSPDGKRMAFSVVAAPDKEFVVIDGNEGQAYQNVGRLCFSPDSQRVLYTAWHGGKSFIVVDGEPGNAYDVIGQPSQPFSPDSRRVAYLAKRNGLGMVVVDGKEEKAYEDIPWFWFSSDSRRVAYVAQRGKSQFAVVDGKEGKPYDQVGWLTFSPDSRHLAFFALDGDKGFVVVDGVEIRSKEYSFSFAAETLTFDDPKWLHTLAARADRRGTELFRIEVEILDGAVGESDVPARRR